MVGLRDRADRDWRVSRVGPSCSCSSIDDEHEMGRCSEHCAGAEFDSGRREPLEANTILLAGLPAIDIFRYSARYDRLSNPVKLKPQEIGN